MDKILIKYNSINLSELVSENPLLNLSIPLHLDNWKTEKEQLVVVAWKSDDSDFLNSYDIKGNLYKLDQNVEPNVPVLVVGFNERVVKGNIESNIISKSKVATTPKAINLSHGNAGVLYFEWEDLANETAYEVWRSTGGNFSPLVTTSVNQNFITDSNLTSQQKYFYKVRGIVNGGPTAWSPLVTSKASSRNDGESFKITGLKFTPSALAAVEKWASGAPELKLRVLKGNENITTAATYLLLLY